MSHKWIPIYKTVDELLNGAVKSTLFQDVQKQITENDALKLSDSDVAHELESWSLIANKTVGHEDELTL